VNARGVPSPHPRKAFLQDFSQLRSWSSAGHEFIVSGDLNELLGENPDEFGSIATEFDLADVYRHRHGMEEPATFNCGHRRLDYILCSVPLLPTVTACGILPFNILLSSDHRTVFVDFDTNMLFGSLPSELASCNDPQFKSRNYESSEQFLRCIHIAIKMMSTEWLKRDGLCKRNDAKQARRRREPSHERGPQSGQEKI
jgi:hypothetical protein